MAISGGKFIKRNQAGKSSDQNGLCSRKTPETNVPNVHFQADLPGDRYDPEHVYMPNSTDALLVLRESEITKLRRQNTALNEQLALIRDDERSRIARDLHDGVAQTLGVIKYNLEAFEEQCKPHLSDVVMNQLEDSIELARSATSELRRIINHSMMLCVTGKGLLDALNNLCSQLDACQNDTLVMCTINVTEEDVPDVLRTIIYRICQEALSNALVHADASRIEVKLQKTARGVCVKIIDDGKGFDTKNSDRNRLLLTKLGLRNMRRRAESVNATFHIESQPDAGCEVQCNFSGTDL